MIAIVGASAKALLKEMDFVSNITKRLMSLDSVSRQIRIDVLGKLRESGLLDRVMYNSISLGYRDFEKYVCVDYLIFSVKECRNKIER